MILVDEIRHYPQAVGSRKLWSHMTSDASEAELHEMAQAIGLRREWFQDHPTHPHYDITPPKRRAAIARGAVEVTSIEALRRCYKHHAQQEQPK